MELIDTGMSGTIYGFNLDLLTKQLTLKVFIEVYDPKSILRKRERK